MRARFIIYATVGSPDAPPPPPDPSIAEAAARRESVAIIQAQARRSSRYGQASLQLDGSDPRPSTTEPAGGPKGVKQEPPYQGALDAAGAQVDNSKWLGTIKSKMAGEGLTDADKATNAARALDYEVERLMARRNARIGVTSSLGNG